MRSLIAISLISLAACGGGSGGDGDDETFNCEQDTNHDELLIGTTKAGAQGLLSFKLIDLTPSPPARMFNTWTVEVSTIAGVAPVSNATLDVFPYMPVHGHGAGIDVEVTAMPTAGQYELDPINLHMPGVWEVTINAESDAGDDVAVFKPCIPN